MQTQNAGTGDAVYLWTGKAANWAVTSAGAHNFIVTTYDTSSLFGTNLLINTIGAYNGTVAATDGPAVVTIQASGAWTVNVE